MGLSDRGVGVQAAGFAVVGCVSLATLQLFSDSDYWLYQWFEMAVTRLYWAFVVPLAALFDWGRIMFAKGKAIREAKKAEIMAKMKAQVIADITPEIQAQVIADLTPEIQAQVMQQSAELERRRIVAILASHGVELDKEVVDEVFEDSRSG